MDRTNQITLVSGVPGSGKTYFGDWLQAEKGFLHIDMEAFQGSTAHQIWNTALRTGNLPLFLDHLRGRSPNVVLTWGFHPNNFPLVRALRDAGVVAWYFTARPNGLGNHAFEGILCQSPLLTDKCRAFSRYRISSTHFMATW
jgi:hypothetical protein